MKRIGITGPTGAGKTTALNVLTELGAHIIDADQVYHDLLAHSAPMGDALTARFGSAILDETGQVDRKALARQGLADPPAGDAHVDEQMDAVPGQKGGVAGGAAGNGAEAEHGIPPENSWKT